MIEEIKPLWVKRHVSKKDYEEYYQFVDSYTYLGAHETKGGASIGFMVVNTKEKDKWKYSDGFLPFDCEPLNSEELYLVRDARKSANISPIPAVG